MAVLSYALYSLLCSSAVALRLPPTSEEGWGSLQASTHLSLRRHTSSIWSEANSSVVQKHDDGQPGTYQDRCYMPAHDSAEVVAFTGQLRNHIMLSSTAWGLMPQVAFNPSIAKLPETLVASLHPQAYYVVAVRHTGDQCDYMGKGFLATRKKNIGSSALLLDANFKPLAGSLITDLGKISPCEDIRLLVNGGKVLASCMTYSPGSRWHFRGLNLQYRSGKFMAQWGTDITAVANQRNLGVFTTDQGKTFNALWFAPSWGTADVRPLIFKAGRQDSEPWHNNINPLELPGENAYLAVGHVHGFNKTVAHFGSSYHHRFILIDAKTYSTRQISPSFCFPSRTNNGECETIQFISSVISRDEDLVITYGVNDCEAAMVQVSLEAVLQFIRSGRHVPGSLQTVVQEVIKLS